MDIMDHCIILISLATIVMQVLENIVERRIKTKAKSKFMAYRAKIKG